MFYTITDLVEILQSLNPLINALVLVFMSLGIATILYQVVQIYKIIMEQQEHRKNE